MKIVKKVKVKDKYMLYLQYVRFTLLVSNKFLSKREIETIAALQMFLDNGKGFISSNMRQEVSKRLKISYQNLNNLLKSMSLKGILKKDVSGYYIPKVFTKKIDKELLIKYYGKLD